MSPDQFTKLMAALERRPAPAPAEMGGAWSLTIDKHMEIMHALAIIQDRQLATSQKIEGLASKESVAAAVDRIGKIESAQTWATRAIVTAWIAGLGVVAAVTRLKMQAATLALAVGLVAVAPQPAQAGPVAALIAPFSPQRGGAFSRSGVLSSAGQPRLAPKRPSVEEIPSSPGFLVRPRKLAEERLVPRYPPERKGPLARLWAWLRRR